MARIIACFGLGEPKYSGAKSIVRALRRLGHEVLTCGASYSYMGSCDVADIPMPDKPPLEEAYTYDEVLGRVSGSVDLVIQIEPHFALIGRRPTGLRSLYYIADPHRSGIWNWKFAQMGSFTHLVCSQKRYERMFWDLGARVTTIAFGFDSERLDRNGSNEPRCAFAFCGQTGIANMQYPYEDEIGRYATHPPQNLPNGRERYAFQGGYDYAERAELLIQLSQVFELRMYDRVSDENYQKVLQAGVVGFSRSLIYDHTYRLEELAAAGRLPISDFIEGQDELIPGIPQYHTFNMKPWLGNFHFEVKEAMQLISYWLSHDRERNSLEKKIRNYVWENNTWDHRVKSILNFAMN